MRARSLVVLLLVLVGAHALASEPPRPLGFEGPRTGDLPDGWRHVPFSGKTPTVYALVGSGSSVALRATADRSASFVIRRAPDDLDLRATPHLRWRWRVDRTIPGGDGRAKETDDFAARVWVGFAYDWSKAGFFERRAAADLREQYGFEPPGHWIHYTWTGRGRQRGDAFPEPYKPERFRCIALRTDRDPLAEWLGEEVDPAADYARLYGEPAPAITAIAVMTDADDLGTRAEALYADLAFVGSRS